MEGRVGDLQGRTQRFERSIISRRRSAGRGTVTLPPEGPAGSPALHVLVAAAGGQHDRETQHSKMAYKLRHIYSWEPLRSSANLFGDGHRVEMPLRIFLHLVGTLEELCVRHELLHCADVHLARAETGRADLVLQMLPSIRFSALIQRLGGVVQDVAELLGILAVVQIAVRVEQEQKAIQQC